MRKISNVIPIMGPVLLLVIALAIGSIPIFVDHAHADGIGAGNTVDNNLLTGSFSTYVAVPNGSGNWVTVNLDPQCKYYVRNFGIAHDGSAAANKIMVLLNAATEPSPSAAVVYTAATNVDYIKPDEAIYPIRGTSVISFKADTGETMLVVRKIETQGPNEH